MASVGIENVVKSYGGHSVLHGVSVDIPDGSFVVLVGPSGCGKSTLLRMIAGLEDISGGTIRIGGKAVNDLPPKERDISMVFQNYALYPHMTVAENMAFSLTLAGVSKADKAAQVARAAEQNICDGEHQCRVAGNHAVAAQRVHGNNAAVRRQCQSSCKFTVLLNRHRAQRPSG